MAFLLGGDATSALLQAKEPEQAAARLQERWGDHYARVAENAASRRPAWRSVWEDLKVDPRLAEAVIFPELIRYGYWQDKVEEGMVVGSYLLQGSSGADFSIGQFQMKASFVEKLEQRWMRCSLHRELEIYFDTGQNRFARKARVARLRDPFWQSVYLGIFLRLLYIDIPSLGDLPMNEQVRLCATAYNHGVDWTMTPDTLLEKLYECSTHASYHLDFVATPFTRKYVYGEVSLEYYLTLTE